MPNLPGRLDFLANVEDVGIKLDSREVAYQIC